jgi:hypothetical protein
MKINVNHLIARYTYMVNKHQSQWGKVTLQQQQQITTSTIFAFCFPVDGAGHTVAVMHLKIN